MSTSMQRSHADEGDDLDDLDDVLDQFSSPAQPEPPSTNANASASASASAQSPQPQPATDEALTDEFVSEFARGMESLLTELGASGAGSEGAGDVADRRQLAAAWEAMLVEGMDAGSGPSTSNARTSTDMPTEPNSDFQSRIRSTVNRIRETESGLQPPESSAGAGENSLESLLSHWAESGGDVPQSEEAFKDVLEEMMSQLMSKDVLYGPLKELYEKFPAYLTKHASTISPEDKKRYEAQISCIKRLIDVFEANTYRDDDENARQTIVDLMGELQTHGKPPDEVMGPLPPGFDFSADGLPEMPDGCNMN